MVFFEVAVYFLLLSLLLRRCGSVLSWVLAVGVWCWLFRCVLGVGLLGVCVSCCVFLLVGCLVVWLCPRFCGAVASCVCRVGGVCLLVARVFRVVFLLLLVLFCFGLSAVLWSSWCWLCVVALLYVLLLLVGCRGCVALSAFLLLVCFAPPVRCTVLVLVAPGWFVCCSSGSFGGRSSGVALSAVLSRSGLFVVLLLV